MKKNNKKEYYFVYGSLKQGHGNHTILAQSDTAKLVEEATTEPIYTMYSLGFFPGVVEGGDTAIIGEIYEVSDAETKRRLDSLEGYYGPDNPHNLYNKETIKINKKNVHIYLFNRNMENSTYKIVKTGKW